MISPYTPYSIYLRGTIPHSYLDSPPPPDADGSAFRHELEIVDPYIYICMYIYIYRYMYIHMCMHIGFRHVSTKTTSVHPKP